MNIAESFWKLSVTATLYLLDSWDKNENDKFYIKIDDTTIHYIT